MSQPCWHRGELGGDGYACQSITSRAPATDAGNFRNVANAGSIEFDPAALVGVLLQKLISCFTANAMYFLIRCRHLLLWYLRIFGYCDLVAVY